MSEQVVADAQGQGRAPAEKMVWVPGGSFLMGSEDFYPEERPVREFLDEFRQGFGAQSRMKAIRASAARSTKGSPLTSTAAR